MAARISLYILFWTIALITAGAAALALVNHTGDSEQQYFVLLLLMLLAILAPLIAILHRPAFRVGGLVLCALFLSNILVLAISFFGQISGNVFLSWLEVSLFMGLPAGVALLLRSKPWGRWFANTLPPIAAIALGMILLALWHEQNSSLAFSALVLLLYGTAASVLLINVGRGDKRYFRWPGIAAALAAIILGFIAIWKDQGWNDPYHFASRTVGLLAVTLAFINMLLMTRQRGLTRICQWTAIAITILTAIAVQTHGTISFFYDRHHDDNAVPALPAPGEEATAWALRAVDASLFLLTGATLCLLTARELLRLKFPPTSPTGIDAIALTCPSCGTAQTLLLNRPACHHCLLRFNIKLFEPHCPQCDHLLLNLTSDRCPECGHPISRPPSAPEPTPSFNA